MATTSSQDRDFLTTVISTSLLEDSIEWIADNLDPDQVFSDKQLASWAESAGYELAGER